jgi:phospholipid-binding lipoprotein MlaA
VNVLKRWQQWPQRLVLVFLLGSCGLALADAEVKNPDPWEGMNRKVFVFNEGFDRFVLRPIAVSYRWITPDSIDRGVTNFFTTVADVPDAGNALLQGKFKKSGISISRFFINLTLGFFGIFDVAKDFGLFNQDEDFGQTLAAWGVPNGPYVVLPFLGGNTLRDGLGFVPDVYMSPLYVENVPLRNSLTLLRFTDIRADLINFEGLVSGDKYIFYRDAYLQRRNYLIHDGVIEDSFGTDLDEGAGWLDE